MTQADLHYVGSLTIDRTLMESADLMAGEKVDVVDIDNGTRLTTYVIEGPADTGVIGINGAAARLISPGDLVIIIAYASVPQDEVAQFQASVVFVDERNRPMQLTTDPAMVPDGHGLRSGEIVATGSLRP